MASPFRYFRKHTKAFMATAAVLAIFIFVVGGALKPGGRDEGGERNDAAIVATWNGGSLNQGQLRALVSHRVITDSFLKQLFVEGGGRNFQYDFPRNIPFLLLPDTRKNEDLQQQVINTEVMSSLATQAGLTVSDNLIVHYIDEMGLKKVGNDEIQKTLANLAQRNAAQNEAIVFATLRKLLLAYFYGQMYGDQSQIVMPQERWDDWRKVNERISLQAAELPIDKFLSQVPEPNETQLLTYFSEHKDADPNRIQVIGGQELPTPEPGFAEPHRVRLQYLKGVVAERAAKLEPSITEEEIKKYYDEKKDTEFIKIGGAAEPFDAKPPAAAGAEAATPPASTEKPAGEPGAQPTPPAATTPPTTNPAPATEATKPAETKPAESPAAPAQPPAATAPPSTPATAPPTGTAPGADAPAEGQPKASSSSIPRRSPFQLVAFQAPAAETAAPAEEKPAAPPATTPPAAEPSAEKPAAPAAPTDAKPADPQPPATPATETKPPEPSATAPAGSPDAPGASAEKKEPAAEFEPLEKVRDDIRKKLAAEKAQEELDRVLGEAAAELQAEYNRYGSQLAEALDAHREAPKPPARLADLKWLADKFALTYEKTAPLTILELRDTPLGQARDVGTQRVSVTEAAFFTLKLYEPFLAGSLDGDGYLALKTEDVARRVPEFKEVRDQVAKAWKQQEAGKLAEKEAKKLAAEAEKSPQPFDQFFAEKGYNVIKQTELFSWLSYPLGREGMGMPPGLSKIPEMKNAGPALMEAVFGLDGTKTLGLLNHDHTMAYVVRLNRRQYSEDELKKLFLEDEGPWPGQVGMTMLRARIENFDGAVNEELIKNRANFEYDPEWRANEEKRLRKQQEP